ncbi:uncharacterized protein ACRADG_008882 [Cochliomyia hominivorax]
MARKSQILRLITVIAIIGLFIIILMNIFNNGHSYYYIHVERKLQMQQQKVWPNLHFRENSTIVKIVTGDHDVTTNTTQIQEIQQQLPNLPITYYFSHSKINLQLSENCAKYPDLRILNFYNTFWQTFTTKEIIFHLYGAYYDERPNTGPLVRVLAMINYQETKFPKIYCQLWFENVNEPIISSLSEYNLIWDRSWRVEMKTFFPYLLSCKLPQNMNISGDPIPKAVNLVEHQCDTAANSLKVVYNKPEYPEKKQQFAVCVKGLEFPYEDQSSRLVEWLEMLKILGVHKVYMYELNIHVNISKVLNYYRENGFVEVRKTSLVRGVVGVPDLEHWLIKHFHLNKILNELIPYNDCFYRNMYKYEYIALLDIDEIIMPKGNLKTWHDLVITIKPLEISKNCSNGFASLCARNIFYPSKIAQQQVPIDTYPNYMHMLNHGYRLAAYSPAGLHVKCLHRTDNVIMLHNHYPFSHFNLYCPAWPMPTTTVQMQHYRETITSDMEAHDLVWDNNIERFKEPLIERCTQVLKYLKLIN